MKVLIVDDGAANIKLLRAVLESGGHEVYSANDGVEALEALQQQKVDAIISDILMPRMDGYRLCDEVRRHPIYCGIPFIFYTATYTSPGDRKLCLDLGCDRYMVKPAPANELLATLEELTGAKAISVRGNSAQLNSDTVIKEYNERLVFKLEEKNIELLATNEELLSTKGKLAHLLEHNPVVLYATKIEADKVTPHTVSENIFQLLGFDASHALSLDWWIERTHPEDRARAHASLQETLEKGAARVEYRLIHRDGSFRWVEDHRRVLHDAEGNATEFVGALSDVTERKQAEDVIHALNARYLRQEQALARLTRLHVSNAEDLATAQEQITELTADTLDVERVSIWRHEPGRKSLVCKELLVRTGLEHSSGQSLLESNFPAYFEALNVADILAAHNAHTDPRTAEFSEPYLTPLGITSMMDAPIHLQGRVAGVVCCEHVGPTRTWSADEQTFLISVANIVSLLLSQVEQRKMEDQFVQAQKMEAIGQLAGGIAHDFNNILGAIMGYTGMAQMETTDDTVIGYLQEVLKGSQRAADLVKQILAFSRRQEQERTPTQLKYVIQEALKLLRASVPVSIKFQSRLGSTPPVLANPTAIHQVVMNLGTNAWHAMRDNAGTLTTDLSSFLVDPDFAKANPDLQPGPYVRLSVSDSGSGMDRATIQRIFEPFFTTKEPGEGTGLGLAAVHGIMKTHDGAITVYSQLGKGTTFHLYFPAYGIDALAEQVQTSAPPRGNGERILFLDDEEPLAQLGKAMLEKLGYRVIAHTNPLDALAVFNQAPSAFDVVITDLTMPVMDGIKFGLQLLSRRPDLPLVLTTGYSGTLTQESIRELGFCELVPKPNTLHTLGEALQRVLHPVQEVA